MKIVCHALTLAEDLYFFMRYLFEYLNKGTDQPNRSPMSMSSSSSAGGGGFAASFGFSAGFSAFFSSTGAGAEAGAPPPTDPKKSETLFPLSALATALTSTELTEMPAALRTALSESALT